ncbi:dipicolinate synthase subunit DpsA [Haloplasma contractile]|uniref:Adenosylhomocysteinase protein n=1 Tax=Haloplasma contractile SSD-17B TaxID=1033810 RepID=U2FRU9_9MOLU|nr:dipicolinate synthase subunit DpsA [Haloplasma contractile]ERJ13689.1 adenosylhomocysteinase protein [Haloplasma contractile SSD-17B]
MCKILIVKNQDERLVYVFDYLKKQNVQVIMITNEDDFKSELIKRDVDAVILPVRGVSDQGEIDGTDIMLSKENLLLLQGKTLFSGLLNSQFNQMCKQVGVKFITYLDDDVAIKNNYITVEGVISHITNSSRRAILNSNTLVIGYGKLGQITASVFKELQSHVTVVARSQKDRIHAKISGFGAMSYNDLIYKIDRYDFIINTVPAHVIDEILLDKLSKTNVEIIDLASKPYGLNHELAKIKKVETTILKGVPGKIAPKTSGELIAINVVKFICGGDDDDSR